MDIKELYEKIGGKYEDVLGRLMKDSLIEKFALMYPKDTSYNLLMSAVKKGDTSEAFQAAHTLKGVSANLSFEELRVAADKLTEQLRPQNAPPDINLVNAVKEAHHKVNAGLAEYIAQK